MSLSLEQLQTIKADILANPDLASQPTNSDGDYAVRDLYNLPAVPEFIVWRGTTPLDDIQDAIEWAKLTPAAAPDGTATWTNRALHAQGKQFNLQNLMIGRTSIPTGKANWRAAFQDALTGLPTKADGGTQPAGWLAVQAAMQRPATRIEKLLVTGGLGTTQSPGTLGFDGQITPADIAQARTS